MFVHVAKGVIPTAPGVESRTDNQVVVAEFEFDRVLELTLLQKCFGIRTPRELPIRMSGTFIRPDTGRR